MKLLVNRAEILTIDVGIDLCRRDVDVTEHFLHRAQIGTAFEQVRGERMPERAVRRAWMPALSTYLRSIFHAPFETSAGRER